MFRNKSDVDKHVAGLLYKAKNEHERNLRCFHIAQLYFKSQDYESAHRYVTMYLGVRDDSAAAHKLLGQALEGLGRKEKALDAYTKSLKIEPDQSDLILKMCELLCDKEVEFNPVLARHWADRASSVFPHAAPVFSLKERLLASDSTLSSKDLEGLLHAELKAKPSDLNVRIKLLKLYADSGRTELALKNAFEVESRLAYVNCFAWYQCVNNICKIYNKENSAKCDWEFYIQWISALDKMCSLCIAESTSTDSSDAADCVYSFDQAIKLATQCPKQPEILREFLKHMSAELSYHIGVLLMKKEKKENSHWKETKRLVSPLFLLSYVSPPQPDQTWALSLKDSHRKLVQQWVHQAHCRNVQAGYLLMSLVKENHSEKMFLDKVNHFISSDWRRQIYEKAFSKISERSSVTSHFRTGAEFNKVPLKVPHSNTFKPSSYISSFENCYYGSLHHLTWLGLRCLKKSSILEVKLPSFHTTCFKSLQFTINNLNNISIETINRLDVDSFVYATVFSTASILEEQKTNGFFNEDRPQILPADISSPLCSTEQAKWWSNLCNLIKGGMSPQISTNESMSDLRFSLQRGLEVVRGEGLSPFIMVALARTFASRAALSDAIEESEGCQARALHLYQLACPMLERLVANKPLISPPKANPLFESSLKEVTPNEAKALLEEAKFFIGTHYLNTRQYERAVEEFKCIRTPEAVMNLGTVYQKWAEEQIEGVKGEEITSEIRCRHGVLATRAKDYLIIVKNMIKNEPKHPLHAIVESKIVEVEDMLVRIEPENGITEKDVNGTTDGSASYESNGSPITEALNIITSTNQRNRTHHHTSTPRRIQEEKTNRFNMSELIDLLSVQQSTNQLKMQQVLEQIRLVLDKLENVVSEQRTQRNLVEGLNSRLNSFESEMKTNISDIKKDMKRPELCNMFDEDDYTDEMLQYQSYPQFYSAPQRVVQNTAAPPAAVPYVNPQYFSPRIDPLCPGFYNQQGALPFSEGQQLPDFLRQSKVSQPLLHPLQPGIPPPLSLAPGVPGPSRLGAGASVISSNIVISNTDTLSSVALPALSVNIPPSQRLTTPGVPHNFQIPLPPQPKPTFTIEERDIEEETPPPTYDPLPNYKPIVPLPDEVKPHTGEENEEILFEKKAKLYRYDAVDKAWKERGTGIIKILKDKNIGKVRILMRRDQVHKICANHFLTADMDPQPKVGTPNSWVWYAHDFADEKMVLERLCVKFKTSEESEEFKTVFDNAKEELKAVRDVPSSDQIKPNEPKSLLTPVYTGSNVPSTPSLPNFFANIEIAMSKPPIFSGENNPPVSSSQMPTTLAPTNVGGFTFSLSQPKLKAPEIPKPEKEVSTEPSPFTKFNFALPTTSKDPATIFSAIGPLKQPEAPNLFSKSFGSSVSGTGNNYLFSSQIASAPDANKDKDSEAKGVGNRSDMAPGSQVTASKQEEEEEDETNFVPTATFEPVIPLPKLVPTETGEENEEIIFEDHAQLYRFSKETREWKERGKGQMKILKNNESGTVRLLMRRDKVHKVCCNHRITQDISLKPASSSDRAFTWATLDHSEKEPTEEVFSLKFKTQEQALRFKEAFEKAQAELSSKSATSTQNSANKNDKVPLSSLLKKAPGSWECSQCYTSNKAESSMCVACTAPKTPSMEDKTKTSIAEKTSEVSQKESAFSSTKDAPVGKTSIQPLSDLIKPKPGSWECKACYIRNYADVEICAACGTVKPGASIKPDQIGAPKVSFSFGIPETSDSSPFTGVGFSSTSQFVFGSPSGIWLSATTTPGIFTASTEPSLPSLGSDKFTFAPAKFSFGAKEQGFGTPSNTSTSAKTGFVFSTSSPATQSDNVDSTFGSKTFQFSMPIPNVSSPPGNKSLNDESGYDPEEEEDHVQFQPVVPLPDKVDVVTGEEFEDILYSHRAKLYRFETTSKEWKERGVGDVKILQHKDTKKIRLLMRREPVMKVCLNHLITSDISLRPKDDKSWIWYAVDYSDGTESKEKFAIRFKNAEIAVEFKDKFDEAKLLVIEPSSSASSSVTVVGNEGGDRSKESSQEGVISSSDSDVELVSEQKAPPELVKKALALQLPANYYCYLEKPPCPGCCGCEKDDEDESPAPSCDKTGKANEDNNEKNQLIKGDIDAKVNPDGTKSQSFGQNLFGRVEQPLSASEAPTIFGGPTGAAKSAGFTFAQAFNSNSDEASKTTSGFLFGGQTSFAAALPAPQNSIFGMRIPSSEQKTPQISFGIGKELPTFGSVASGQGDQTSAGLFFGNAGNTFPSFGALAESKTFSTGQGDFKWEGAGQQIFSSLQTNKANESSGSVSHKNEEDSDEEEEGGEGEVDPYFEPVVPLPAKVSLQTGEEEEEILFCERALLYRFSSDTKEWKERGVGDMKILKNKAKNIFRLLMRREKVFKIVCNQLLMDDIEFKRKSDQAFMWSAINFYDGEQNLELLSIKFKTPELASKFKSIIDDCLKKLKEEKAVTAT